MDVRHGQRRRYRARGRERRALCELPDKNLYALNASTGGKLLTTFTGVAALENVVVSNGNVFLGLATGHLRRLVLPD